MRDIGDTPGPTPDSAENALAYLDDIGDIGRRSGDSYLRSRAEKRLDGLHTDSHY